MPTQFLTQNLKQTQSQKLSMKTYIPLLQCHTKDLYTHIKKMSEGNPSIEVKESSGRVVSLDKGKGGQRTFGGSGDLIQEVADKEGHLYEKLESQITDSIFPTEESQNIARVIIENINNEGFFEGDIEAIALEFDVEPRIIEGIRSRFSLLEPPGVGSIDYKESFLVQLDEFDVNEELYQFCKKVIQDFENMKLYAKESLFSDAKKVFKHFKNPPAIDYMEDSRVIIPEILVTYENDKVKVSLNNSAYPEVIIKDDEKFKNSQKSDAKHLFNLIELRKSTLLKIGEILATRQIDFFKGGDLKGLTMQELADIVEFNQSTISRAISGKYLACDRGLFPIKHFFASEVENGVTNSTIKDFILEIIKEEKPNRMFGDDELASFISRRFGVKIVRRTVGKYREELGIPNKRERKELLKISSS